MSNWQPDPPPALIAEATKRAGVIWIKAPGPGRPRPAWHRWRDTGSGGAASLLTGPGEQPLADLLSSPRVTVLVPGKESGGLLLTWEADVTRVEPGSAGWQQVIGLLVAGRLNGAPAADSAAVYRLTPAA